VLVVAFHYVQRAVFLAFAAVFILPEELIRAEPPAKTERTANTNDSKKTTTRTPTRAQLIEAANGWMYVNGEWVHPDGYKFVNNKVLRTTAKRGRAFPKPPDKLALENPTKLTPRIKSSTPDPATAAEKAAEERRKNLQPRPASQTGTHL
jgi:hypothetical protein